MSKKVCTLILMLFFALVCQVQGQEESLDFDFELLLSGKTQITYKSLRNCLYIGNSAFFFEIQAP